MSHKTPEVTKLVLTITKGIDRFKMKKRYEVQDADTLKKDADNFINTVLSGDTDKLKQDDIVHRVMSRKAYMKDKF